MKNLVRTAILGAIAILFTLSTKAQLYYSTSDGTGASTSATDAFYKVESNGSGNTLLYSSTTQSPSIVELDKANDRFFLYEAFTGVRGIKVFRLSTGALLNTISSANIVTSMEYDPTTNYIYYLTSDGASTTGTNDALVRVRPDGTGSLTLKASLSEIPLLLALDISHNKIYYYDGLATSRGVRTFDLVSNSITQTVSTQQLTGLEYYIGINYLYMLGTDGSATTTTAADCLLRMRPDGTSPSTIASSITASPSILALDVPNNKAYIYNAFTSTKSIVSIDLVTATMATLVSTASLPGSQVVVGLATETSRVVLPVKWLGISAGLTQNKTVVVTWSVQEYDVASYTLERSSDGLHFHPVGSVVSKGNGAQNYQYTDGISLSGNGYYRIQQTDKDGNHSWSAIAKIAGSGAEKVIVSPNPTTANTKVVVGTHLLHTDALLTGSNGQLIRKITITDKTFTINLSSLPVGTYLLSFADGTNATIIKN